MTSPGALAAGAVADANGMLMPKIGALDCAEHPDKLLLPSQERLVSNENPLPPLQRSALRSLGSPRFAAHPADALRRVSQAVFIRHRGVPEVLPRSRHELAVCRIDGSLWRLDL